MLTYAGIGSRSITEKETETIIKIANKLSKKFILFSGNSEGSDIAFERGSNNRCVLFLPWTSFNAEKYQLINCLDSYVLGKSEIGNKSIDRYYPNQSIKYGVKMMMSRNYHQVMGYNEYPKVSFLICCANENSNGDVEGGTGHVVRIARDHNVPVINIRIKGWRKKLAELLDIP